MEYFTRLRNFWFPDLNALWWLLLALPALYLRRPDVTLKRRQTLVFIVPVAAWAKFAPPVFHNIDRRACDSQDRSSQKINVLW